MSAKFGEKEKIEKTKRTAAETRNHSRLQRPKHLRASKVGHHCMIVWIMKKIMFINAKSYCKILIHLIWLSLSIISEYSEVEIFIKNFKRFLIYNIIYIIIFFM